MRQVDERTGKERSISPNRFDADLYIIKYQQHQNQIIQQADSLRLNHPKPIVSHSSPSYNMKQKEGELGHRKNIDRLMTLIKRNQNNLDNGNSACSKIFKYIQKMYKRYWRIRERNYKLQAFNAIKYETREEREMKEAKRFPFTLKDSLEMRENEIQRGSKNFEINELIHIVNLHENNDILNKEKLENSLSKELIDQRNEGKQQKTPKKVSSNVFILRKNHSKDDISTRQQLSNNQIPSQQFLPISTRIARSISHNSIDKSPSKSINDKDRRIEQPAHRNFYEDPKENKLQELKINSMVLNQSQQISQGNDLQEVVKIKFPCLGTKKQKQQGKRTNRLMQNTQRKIIFHYRNSKEREASPTIQNEYHLPRTFVKDVPSQQLVSKILQKAPTIQSVQNQQPTRFQRISSLQILNPNSLTPHQNTGSVNSNPSDLTKDRANSLSTRRWSSMPKITFTYLNKEEPIVVPQLSQNLSKNSPILELNKLKGLNSKNKQGDDPYLFKNIEIAVTKPMIQPLYSPAKKRPEVYQTSPNAQANNNYHLPNFVPSNHPASPRPQRTKIISNYQSISSNQRPYIVQQRNDYYGQKSKIATQQTLNSPSRMRVRSTDAYILIKLKQHNPNPQKIISNTTDRQRARSSNIKMEVVTRKMPLMKAC